MLLFSNHILRLREQLRNRKHDIAAQSATGIRKAGKSKQETKEETIIGCVVRLTVSALFVELLVADGS